MRNLVRDGQWSHPVGAAAYVGIPLSISLAEPEWIAAFDAIERQSEVGAMTG